MNKPTPPSTAEFALQALVAAGHVSQELVDQARALPGAPQPAHSGEPVAYCQPDDSNAGEAFSWPGTNRREWHTTPLYTAPQPVAPTPEAQVFELLRGVDSLDALAVWRAAEAAHGIKGGQHADT